jgi:hypothetical protein
MDVYQLVTGTEGISYVVLLRPPIVLLSFLVHGIVTAKLYCYKITTTFHCVSVLLGFTATLSVMPLMRATQLSQTSTLQCDPLNRAMIVKGCRFYVFWDGVCWGMFN